MCDISARIHCLAERSKIGQTVTGKYANAMRVSNSIAAATARRRRERSCGSHHAQKQRRNARVAVASVSSANSREAETSTSSSVPAGERDRQQVVVASKDQHEPVKGVHTAPTGRDTPPDVQPPDSATPSVDECMDVSRDGASSMAGKRAHERTVDSEPQRDDGGGGEPPTKTLGVRRSPYRPRPNIPGEPRRAGNPPP
ncbi:hypothetical protein HPB50_023293 [Hyalomma asiaticum]|uniref:Uncharacterized protein n=1 Tax=Hyalomma asiaticum TaxID=266040 RepID=A0ACB7SQ40_HYAAI|nr:hypothetical protein HPB50_023293 [Hyalomma asiaticum]